MPPSIEHPFGRGKAVSADCAAPPETAWALLAAPACWPSWAPQIRRVEGPAALAQGDRIVVHGPFPVRVTATIATLVAGSRWDWVVHLPGPFRLFGAHVVEPRTGGCRILVHQRLLGPGTAILGPAGLAAYAPIARHAVRRLARLAEQSR
jgi:hypothetical protein